MVAIKVETYHKLVIFAFCYRPPKNANNELIFEEIKSLTACREKILAEYVETSICQIETGKLNQSITTSIGNNQTGDL